MERTSIALVSDRGLTTACSGRRCAPPLMLSVRRPRERTPHLECTGEYLRLAVRSGVIIPVLVMLPNVAWMLLPKSATGTAPAVPIALTIVENLARIATLALPVFCALQLMKKYSALIVAGMALALIVYYSAWARYFLGGSSPVLLSAPLAGIPLPLAVAPVALLVLSAYVLDSWWMLGVSLVFGVAHIWTSNLRT